MEYIHTNPVKHNDTCYSWSFHTYSAGSQTKQSQTKSQHTQKKQHDTNNQKQIIKT